MRRVRRGVGQALEFGLQIVEQCLVVGGVAHRDAHALLAPRAGGKRAEVEADDDLVEPLLDVGDDLFIHGEGLRSGRDDG